MPHLYTFRKDQDYLFINVGEDNETINLRDQVKEVVVKIEILGQ